MIIVEPTVSEEKLREFLRETHESSALDHMSTLQSAVLLVSQQAERFDAEVVG